MSTDDMTVTPSDHIELDAFDQASQKGWAWFTRFLLINVILCALGLLFVGVLTVWS
jgi:hypothetical protein